MKLGLNGALAALALAGLVAAPAAAEEVRVAALSAPDSPDEIMWEKFETRLVEATDGALEPVMLIRGETGSEEQMLAAVRRNRVQIGGGSFQAMATVVPEIAVISAPFLWDSVEEMDYVVDEYLTGRFTELFAERGLVFLRWSDVGWVNLYARKPILTPEDARDYRMRAASSIAALHFSEAIDADTISLPFNEVIPALQTGLVEGGATSVTMYTLAGVASEAPHLTMSRHSYDMGVILANRRWFDRLPAEQREAVRSALGEPDEMREIARGMVASIHASLPERGIEVHEWTPEQRDRFVELVRPTHGELLERIGGEAEAVYALIQEGKRAFAAREE